MDLLQAYAKEIVALLVPVLTWLLSSQRGKPRLIRAVRHAHTFHINQPLLNEAGVQIQSSQELQTASIVVHNLGSKKANNVEIVLNFQPMFVNFWPLRNKTIKPQEDDRHVIVYDTLAPGEFVGMELCSINRPLPMVVNVRSDEGPASEVRLTQLPAVPNWKRKLFVALMFLGLGTAVYLLLVLVQFLVLKTPVALGS